MRGIRAGGLVLAMAASSVAAGLPGAAQASPSTGPPSAAQTVYPYSFTQPDASMATVIAPPTRIVVVDNPEFGVDDLVALGVQPIGGLEYAGTAAPNLTQGLFKDITLTDYSQLGTAASSPDLEAIAAAHPDLIVGVDGPDTPNLTQLEAIAPVADIQMVDSGTGFTGIQAQPWYAELELLAKILNRQSQANAFIASYEAAAAKVRPELAGKSVTYGTYTNGGPNIVVEGPQFYIGPILTYLGVTVPPVPSDGSYVVGTNAENADESLSLERVTSLTAQYLLIFTGTTSVFQSFVNNPLVAEVGAARAGRILNTAPGNPLSPYPIEGCVALLHDIPLFAKALETTGQPTYHAVGTVGSGGSLASVNYGGYNGPLYTLTSGTYTHVTNPAVVLTPGTTLYGI